MEYQKSLREAIQTWETDIPNSAKIKVDIKTLSVIQLHNSALVQKLEAAETIINHLIVRAKVKSWDDLVESQED